MLTGAAFNALLKTLEEPPSHAVFILATTEYYKVPATILSRCQQFLFSKIDPLQSAQRLLEVAAKENIVLSPDAAALIARLSDGAMRDALSLLDQCISADDNVDEELVRRCSGSADSGYLFSVSEAAIGEKPADALAVLDKLINQGKDLSRFIEELTLHYRNLMLIKTAGKELVKASDGDLKKYEEQCSRYSLDEIMRHVDLISDSLDSINRMKQTGQARLLSEQLLIRLTSPKLSNDASALAARIGAMEEKISSIIKNGLGAAPAAVNPNFAAERDKGGVRDGDKSSVNSESSGGEAGFDEIPLPPPPDESFGGFAYDYFEPQEGGVQPLSDTISESDHGDNADKALQETLPKNKKTKNSDKTEKENTKPETDTRMPRNNPEEKSAAGVIPESDFELPQNTAELPQWSEIISGLTGSAGRLLKNSRAYLYGGKIYIEASTSAKTVLKNDIKAAALQKRTASVMGGSFELYLLREHKAASAEKEDKITPFLDRARAMGIEVAVKEK